MARVARLNPPFKNALDSALGNDAPSRRRVMGAIGSLTSAERLPLPADREALLPWPGGLGWVHEIRELRLWLQYQFDDQHVTFISVWQRPPVFVDE